jgi:hypothetical protein
MSQNMKEFLRGYAQLRVTVPSYVGVGYSLGAGLSLGMKKKTPVRRLSPK